MTGHVGSVRSVAFSLDDRTLATGSVDGTARLWNLTLPDPRQAVEEICAAVRRDLTPLERTTYLDGHQEATC
ncbi:WD40 repeat domain-containing protein [Streptomyces sp. NPDC050549]|uniref:WD40 repeat domain-containing protein n=1 Tax=Streptomyces sp. NPDC050549 TaxID=3155406 RepID=UPI00341EF8FC